MIDTNVLTAAILGAISALFLLLCVIFGFLGANVVRRCSKKAEATVLDIKAPEGLSLRKGENEVLLLCGIVSCLLQMKKVFFICALDLKFTEHAGQRKTDRPGSKLFFSEWRYFLFQNAAFKQMLRCSPAPVRIRQDLRSVSL